MDVTVPLSLEAEPALSKERRDTEHIITLWRQKASRYGSPPPAASVDFSTLAGSDWGYRFLINADITSENNVFLLYGPHFARLLGLPQYPILHRPVSSQLPERYNPIFSQGCSEAFAQMAPLRLNGTIDYGDGRRDLYRAAFVPFSKGDASPTCLIYGTFNCRRGPMRHSLPWPSSL